MTVYRLPVPDVIRIICRSTLAYAPGERGWTARETARFEEATKEFFSRR